MLATKGFYLTEKSKSNRIQKISIASNILSVLLSFKYKKVIKIE